MSDRIMRKVHVNNVENMSYFIITYNLIAQRFQSDIVSRKYIFSHLCEGVKVDYHSFK